MVHDDREDVTALGSEDRYKICRSLASGTNVPE